MPMLFPCFINPNTILIIFNPIHVQNIRLLSLDVRSLNLKGGDSVSTVSEFALHWFELSFSVMSMEMGFFFLNSHFNLLVLSLIQNSLSFCFIKRLYTNVYLLIVELVDIFETFALDAKIILVEVKG